MPGICRPPLSRCQPDVLCEWPLFSSDYSWFIEYFRCNKRASSERGLTPSFLVLPLKNQNLQSPRKPILRKADPPLKRRGFELWLCIENFESLSFNLFHVHCFKVPRCQGQSYWEVSTTPTGKELKAKSANVNFLKISLYHWIAMVTKPSTGSILYDKENHAHNTYMQHAICLWSKFENQRVPWIRSDS